MWGKGIDLEHLAGVLDRVFTIYDMQETIEGTEDGWAVGRITT